MADAVDGKAKRDATLMEALAALLSSKLLQPLPHAHSPSFLLSPADGCRLLRRFLIFFLHFLLSFLSLILSHLPSPPLRPRASVPSPPYPAADSACAGRGLSRVLYAATRVPAASRKYDLVRFLAERILDDNLSARGGAALRINRAALSAAFARTLALLEAAMGAEAAPVPWDVSGGRIMGALTWGARKWAALPTPAAAGEGVSSEKLAAEVLWLAQKMAESGAEGEAVAMWGAAAGLAGLAMSTEPRLQVALVRVCAFLFKHANSMQLEEGKGGEKEGVDFATSQMAILKSWLPLLCLSCNGVDTPVLSSRERAVMVSVLEEMIEKLNWAQQEEVLSLWLHHFTIYPHSDWPNLESCYLHWYSKSRKLLK